MALRHQFRDADVEAIRAATAAAEQRTGGEIVPYVVGRCDDYPGACWALAAWAGILAAAVAGIAHDWGGFWGGSGVLWITLPVLLATLAGWSLAAALPALRRRLIPRLLLEQRVARRAAEAFVECEVFATRDRTGILLFVALFEHRVLVVADSGIHRLVPQEQWQGIADRLRDGIRDGRAAAALVEALEACGALLEEHGVARRTDDINELPDQPQLRHE